MEPQEYRFRLGRAVLEVFLIHLLVAFGGVAAAAALEGSPDARLVQPAGWFLIAWLAGLCFVFRWRSRIVIDRDGIELRRSRSRVAVRLAWEEIDEVFLLGPARFEVRGAGKSLRFSGAYPDAARAREQVSSRLTGLRDLLRTRALRDGELVFRMPTGLWRAHVAYLLAILFLTGVTGLLLAPFLLKVKLGFPFFVIILGGGWLWNLRRQASGMGTRVTLFRDGLLVRRLDGKDRVAWSELASTEWDGRGGLVLVLRAGRRITVPFSLGNIAILEEFVEESRQAASARP